MLLPAAADGTDAETLVFWEVSRRRGIGLVALILIASLFPAACSRNRQLASAPIPEVRSSTYPGPAPEIENQLTSDPIMLENLPPPPSGAAEALPNVLPPAPLTLPPTQTKVVVEPKRENKPALPPVETRPVAQAPPIQLLPQFSESDKAVLQKKISDQLDSARSYLKSLNESQLTEHQKPNLAAANDFIRKSEDALKRGEFYQGLVLAQKANTLAASLAKTP
jgi:hypothetical protein